MTLISLISCSLSIIVEFALMKKMDGHYLMERIQYVQAQMELGNRIANLRLFTNDDFEIYDKLVFKSNQTVFQVI